MKLEDISALLVVILVFTALGGVLFILFRSNQGFDISQKSCFVDEDCVPAQCCHPTDVVNKIYAPSCSGVYCTEECKKGTIDCGCGKPACVDNKCAIIWTREGKEWC